MLEQITNDTQIEFQFDKKALAPYFDLVFHTATVDERIIFFKNLLAVAQRSLGLAHCIQHDMVSRVAIQEGSSQKARDTILPLGYAGVVGCWSGRKRSDNWSLNGLTVNGTKRWITNIHGSRYFTGQIMRDNVKYSIYIDLNETKHRVGFLFQRCPRKKVLPLVESARAAKISSRNSVESVLFYFFARKLHLCNLASSRLVVSCKCCEELSGTRWSRQNDGR